MGIQRGRYESIPVRRPGCVLLLVRNHCLSAGFGKRLCRASRSDARGRRTLRNEKRRLGVLILIATQLH